MPYKCETSKLHIPRHLDRRVKLSLEDREEIKKLYGTISQRKLAKMFNVSRRLVIFIGCPEKHKLNLKQREERGGSAFYYDSKKQTKQKRKHRRYKQSLYLKGVLE